MRNNKAICTIIICLFFSAIGNGQVKQDISVLYVGYSPEKPIPEGLGTVAMGGMSPERFKAEYGKRMPAFKGLLKTYFTSVKTIDARDYKEEMSSKYDVTVFDQAPPPIKERVIHKDSVTGKFLSMEPAKYVSDDFDKPSVFIGHTASVIGSSLGSKLDWYCLCLDKHAHHINTEHPIFKGPFKTSVTLEKRITPEGIFHYFDGADVPSEIPMWKVNTEGYEDGKGFRVGLVSRGWGFEDSPNAEVISSGVCTKAKTAVALGRHGNFFLWGFAGDPNYMTDEAKKVFANAIVYTDTHAEDKMIARKFNERIATKVYVDELLYYTTRASYLSYVDLMKEFNESTFDKKKDIKKKQAAGETLSEMDEIILNSKPQVIGTREDYIKENIGRNSWSELTGFDTLAIRKYLTDNRPYFFSEPEGFYDLNVDQDIKSLGIANTDIEVLDRAISMLEEGVDTDKAYRILMRYTLEDFTTAKQWRKWFDTYKDNLFFTEAGGYVWMVNDPEANPEVRPRNEAEIEKIKFQ